MGTGAGTGVGAGRGHELRDVGGTIGWSQGGEGHVVTQERDRTHVRPGAAVLAACALAAIAGVTVTAHQLLDRVAARVGTHVITWTDVLAARGLGLLDVPPGPEHDREAIERTIDRQLMLAEVSRFPPAESSVASIDAQVTALRQQAGAGLPSLMAATGLDDRRLRTIARDELRIQAYLDQRFGLAVQVTDEEVRQFYEANRQQFARDGGVPPFESIEGLVRQRAAAERRGVVVGRWLQDLRARTEVVVPGAPPGE